VASAADTRLRKVLLAEDNPVNVEVATAMLDSLGLDVNCARNGDEALQAVRAGYYDAVLMDCQMPLMDGFAATKEIRAYERENGRARRLPIIAITANALQGDRESCLAAGMDDYLSKPFTQQQLANVIGRWIALPSVAVRAAAAAAFHAPAPTPAIPAPAPAPAPETIHARGAAQDEIRHVAPLSATVHHGDARPMLSPEMREQIQRDVINLHALDNIRALSPDRGGALVQRVVKAYVGDTPQHLATMRNAIAVLDTGSLRKVAHSLKSSSANVGAEALAAMCKDMENLGRADSTEGASGILTDMEQEFQAVRHSLSAILEKET
jgi:CheY-like chemotaxis protein